MNIIKASPSDLVEVLYLLRVCVLEMNSKGWFHWDLHNPLVKQDLENDRVFVYIENDITIGTITLNCDEMPEYNSISWSNTSGKSLVACRLLVHPCWRKKGIAKELLAFAEKYARENGFNSLRVDVFSENNEALGLCNQLNYKQQGEIQHQYQKLPYYCFEKTV